MNANRARLTSMHENTRHTPLDACDRVSRDLFETAKSLLRDNSYVEDVCGVAREGHAYSAAQIERVYSVWASRRCAHSERLRSWVADFAAYRVLDARAGAMFKRAESSRGLDAVLLREQAHLLRARGLETLACCMRTLEFDTSITARHIDIAQYAGPCTLVKESPSGAREVMGEFPSRRAACKWLVESRDISHLSRADYACEFADGARYEPREIVDFTRDALHADMLWRNNPRNDY